MSTTLGDVCTFLNGGTPSRSVPRYFEGDIPWITGADIVGPTVESARSFITEEAIQKSAVNRVSPGTVLLVTRTSVGKVAVAGRDLCFSQDITALRPDPQKIDTGFLVHFLRTRESHFERLARGATIKGITRETVAGLSVPLPTLTDQRRIAKVLDQAAALRAKRRAALDQLDTFSQAIFLDLFGDPLMNPKAWEQSPLKYCAMQIQIGPFGSLLHQEDYVYDGIPLVNPMHIESGRIVPSPRQAVTPRKHAELKLYHLRQGDVIMGRRGEMGRCAIVTPEHDGLLCGTGSLFIRPDESKATAIFLQGTLSSPAMRSRLESFSLGATLPNLNRGIVEALPIPVPPIELQHEFARRVAAVEKLKAAHRASLAELDALFASLQHRAFRGEL